MQTTMRRREYYNLCRGQRSAWLQDLIDNGNMPHKYRNLARLVLRKRGIQVDRIDAGRKAKDRLGESDPRPMLQPGYVAYNGHRFSQADCNSYNQVQEEINRYREYGCRIPLEMLNRSCFVFNTIVGRDKR